MASFAHSVLVAALLYLLSIVPAAAQTADVTFTLGAPAAALQSLLGVNAGPLHRNGRPTTKDLYTEYSQIGVKAVRSHDFPGALDMSAMYPDRSKDPSLQSSYNFSSAASGYEYGSDAAVASLQSNGLQLYLRIWDSAETMAAPSSTERANWVKAAVEVVRHYQEGKWGGYSGMVNSVEIGNEPDSTFFWPSPYTKEEFYKLYADTALALRAAFPTLKIGGPGITQSGFSNSSGQAWVRGFLDYVKNGAVPLDFFSWHLYSNTPEDFATAAAFYRSELNSRGFSATEIHLTEWNTSIQHSNPSPTVLASNLEYRTKAKGAAILSTTWMYLQQNGVKQSYFYRGNNPSSNDPEQYGLFGVDGTPWKSALAFGLWSEFSTYENRIDPSAGVTLSGLKALAAQRANGQVAILVANTGSSTRNWSAGFTDGRTLSGYARSLKTMDDSAASTTLSTPSGTVFSIAPNTVQLLLLAPPYQGLWWNPNESGWGLSVTQHKNTIFAALYSYDGSGQPTWYVMSNCALLTLSCSGDLFKVSGGTAPGVAWNGSAKVVASAGSGTLSFADANNATFNYILNGAAGSRSISRQVFATGTTPPAVDYTDLWWNPNESGWGVALTQQYGVIFATWYAYDAAGKALWYVASNCVLSGTACAGDLYQVSGGTPLTSVWNGAGKAVNKVGSVSFSFSDLNNGAMTYSINGVSGNRTITRQGF